MKSKPAILFGTLSSLALLAALGQRGEHPSAGVAIPTVAVSEATVSTVAADRVERAPAMTEELPVFDPRELRAEAVTKLRGAMLERDPDAMAIELARWLYAAPDALADALSRMEAPSLAPLDAEMCGLMLQAVLTSVALHPDVAPGSDVVDIARAVLDRLDASEFASRIAYVALAPCGALLPGELLPELIDRTQLGTMAFDDLTSQTQRLQLIGRWARSMGPEVERELYTAVVDPTRDPNTRAVAVDALLQRDWRAFAPEFALMLQRLREDEGLDAELESHVLMRLAGTSLELHGRERLELVRELVGDSRVGRLALSRLGHEEALDLELHANAQDRAWPEYRWVTLAAGGADAVPAGLALLDDLGSEGDALGSAANVVQSLFRAHGDDPRVRQMLDARFAQRSEAGDPFWGALAFDSGLASDDAVEYRLLDYLRASVGEETPGRVKLIAQLKAARPELDLSWL